jgi:hypothetical protein
LNQKLEDSEDKKEKHKRYTLVVDDINMDSKSTIHVFGPNKVSVSFLENTYPYVIIIENTHLFSYLSSLFDYVRNSKNLNASKL